MTIKHSGGLPEKQYAHLSWSPKVLTPAGPNLPTCSWAATTFSPTISITTLKQANQTLDWITFTRIPRRYSANTNFLRQGFRKLWSDRQTDRHDEIIYHAARFAGGPTNDSDKK